MIDRKLRGFLLTGGGVLGALLVVVLAYAEQHSDSPRISLAGFLLLGLASVALGATGISTLASERRAALGQAEAPATYQHTYRLFGLLIGGLLLAFVARSYAVPETFGQYGYYRGAAAVEARTARTPRLQGKKACIECHEVQYTAHEKDVHRSVQCEDCHGPADEHLKSDEKSGNIFVPKTREACLVCHRQLPARPGGFPQIDWREHYKFVGVKDEKTECMACHDPHEPLFLQKALAQARLHPLIHRCRDCHVGRTDETQQRPPEHPAIFECGYCHTALVKDWPVRTHSGLACTKCHLFLRESDFAGRIVLNRDPRFCLLCHSKADFRSNTPRPGFDAPTPLIDWPAHLTEHDEKNKDDTTPCVKCHQNNIHGEVPTTTGAEESAK